MSLSFDFTSPDSFAAGTVGPKGQRVFFLQARQLGEVVSLRLEKQQVAALADYLEGMLADLPESRDVAPTPPKLIEPVEPSWAIGGLGVVYNEHADRVILVAEELLLEPEDDGPDAGPDDEDHQPAEARFHLSRGQITAFVNQAREVVAAGRPPCPYCGRPMDPVSGFCPCIN